MKMSVQLSQVMMSKKVTLTECLEILIPFVLVDPTSEQPYGVSSGLGTSASAPEEMRTVETEEIDQPGDF